MSEGGNTFSDWSADGGASEFALPGEVGHVAPAPEPAREPVDLGEITADEAETLAALAVQGVQSQQAVREHVVANAVRLYSDGEEEPGVIADHLRDTHGYDVAAEFVQRWKADEAELEYEEPEPAYTADEWVSRERERLDLIEAFQQSERAQADAQRQAELDLEIHKAFNEGVKETRQKARIAADESLFEIINTLGADVSPSTPEEARLVGEELTRQAAEIVRAMKEADLVASFDDTPAHQDIRFNYLPTATDREHVRNAPSPEQVRARRFMEALDPARGQARPSLAESLRADFAEDEARTRMFEDAFKLRDPRTSEKKSPQPSTTAWNV